MTRQDRLFIFIGAVLLIAAAILFVGSLSVVVSTERILNCMLLFDCNSYGVSQLFPLTFYGALACFGIVVYRRFVGSDKADPPPPKD